MKIQNKYELLLLNKGHPKIGGFHLQGLEPNPTQLNPLSNLKRQIKNKLKAPGLEKNHFN